MGRTKLRARKASPASKKRAHEQQKRNKRERDTARAAGLPLQKKSKNSLDAGQVNEEDESMQSVAILDPAPTPSHDLSASTSTAPPIPTELAQTHEVTTMSIISSSKIEQRITRVLSILSEYPAIPPAKQKVVMLYAKAGVVSKLISIVEIAKRDVAKGGGKWFQYNKLGEVVEERKVGEGKGKDEDVSMQLEENEDGEQSGEEFETMKTPFERAIEGKPRVRATPVMSVYLSRVRIESLRKEYTEQTNGLEIPN